LDRQSSLEVLERRELLASLLTPAATPLLATTAPNANSVVVQTLPPLATLVAAPGPVAKPDAYSTPKNTVLTVAAPGVLGNDIGIDGRPLTASVEQLPANGKLDFKPDGSFTYTPNADYGGYDTFVYRATDVSPAANPLPPASSLARVLIFVGDISPIVVANDDYFSTPMNTALDIAPPGVLKNDFVLPFPPPLTSLLENGPAVPPLNVPLKATLLGQPAHGNITLMPDGSFHYTPEQDFYGSDSFTYRASIAGAPPVGTSNTVSGAMPMTRDVATVTICVNPPFPIPVAQNDSYATPQDTTLTVAAPGVLANDRALDDHPLYAVILQQPSSGNATLNPDGSFTYIPTSGFSGYDWFSYRAIDTTVGPPTTKPPLGTVVTPGYSPVSDVAWVQIFVQAAHPRVYAVDDKYQTTPNTALTIAAPGVLGNDSLFPIPRLWGTIDATTTATTLPTSIRGSLPLPVTLNATILDIPTNGQVTLNPDGSFQYTPNADFFGVDTFTYRASATTIGAGSGGTGGNGNTSNTMAANAALSISNVFPCLASPNVIPGCPPGNVNDDIGTVTILVQPPPGPVAKNDNFTAAENTALDVPAPGVLANDYIQPPPVLPQGPPPISPAGVLSALNGILSNRAGLTAAVVAKPKHGTLDLKPDGSFHYVPDADFTGTDIFTYQDSEAPPATTTNPSSAATTTTLSNIATVTIRILPAVAHNDLYTTPQDTPLNVAAPGVLANDQGGSAANPLTANLLSNPLHGSLTLNPDGSFLYTPEAGFSGLDLFTYQATAGTTTSGTTSTSNQSASIQAASDPGTPNPTFPIKRPDSDVALVRIYVRPNSTTIVAHDDKYPTPKNVPLTVGAPGVLANDFGPAGDMLTATLVDKPNSGSVTLNPDGSFTYTPNSDFVGTDTFTYRATGSTATLAGTPDRSLATVTIYVLPTDPLPRFIVGCDQQTTDESGPQKIPDWATLVSAGVTPPSYSVSTDNAGLFASPPAIDADGQLVYTPAPNASGSATVTVALDDGTSGNSQKFTIDVSKPHPLYNAAKPCDVNSDGHVVAGDALLIINWLNAHNNSSHSVDAAEGEAAVGDFYDVSHDNSIDPIDALLVINDINAHPDGEGESMAATDSSLLALLAQDTAEATQGRRRGG
jgi:hypothetical protein